MASTNASARPWLAQYPAHIPHDIDVQALPTLVEMLETSFRDYASKPAFISFGKSLNFSQIGAASHALAGWLQAQNLPKGTRIALMMPNVMAYPVSIFGVLLAGYTVVNVNPLYTARELTHQLNDSGAEVIFVLENFAHVVQQALPGTKIKKVVVASAGDLLGVKGRIISFVARSIKKVVPAYAIAGAIPFESTLRSGAPFKPVAVTLEDIAFLQYTGGTTGVSKGAALTHRNISANIDQSDKWLGWKVRQTPNNVMVTALPLYHIFALTCCCFFMVKIGAACLLIANPRDIPAFIALLRKARFTMFSGVNTLYNALANHPEIRSVDFSNLKFSVAGGMATQGAVAKAWKATSGCPIIEGYGLSETSPVLTLNPAELVEFSGTIGYPISSTEIEIRDLAGANALPQGEVGEICARGPQVMSGYWQRPDETAKVMTADGFFRTGDMGVMLPSGEIKIVDRLKDMILVSGFNVYPNEVEEVLVQHPGVLEVAVVGQEDPQSGEAVVAHVVRKDPNLTAEALREHAKTLLTAYKVPKYVQFRTELPKTNVGKVLRRILRDEPRQNG